MPCRAHPQLLHIELFQLQSQQKPDEWQRIHRNKFSTSKFFLLALWNNIISTLLGGAQDPQPKKVGCAIVYFLWIWYNLKYQNCSSHLCSMSVQYNQTLKNIIHNLSSSSLKVMVMFNKLFKYHLHVIIEFWCSINREKFACKYVVKPHHPW